MSLFQHCGSSLACPDSSALSVPHGEEFPVQSSGCRKEHPNPMALWGDSALLRNLNDVLASFWMSKCIVMFLLLMLY